MNQGSKKPAQPSDTSGASTAWPATGQSAGAGKIGAGGAKLPEDIRKSMEETFNQDFSNVRIMNNSCVPQAVGALAYTHGTDIHFAPGQYHPHSQSGQRLLAHELTHVVQQNAKKTD